MYVALPSLPVFHTKKKMKIINTDGYRSYVDTYTEYHGDIMLTLKFGYLETRKLAIYNDKKGKY